MPPIVIIVKPDITEEERQKRIAEINEVLTETAHSKVYVELEKIAQ